MVCNGHSELTQSQPFILPAQLSHFRTWIEEEDEKEKKKERGRKDHARLVEAKAEVQGKGDLQLCASVFVN